jgi:sigma-B regulation protein RsbU (phosphoserine phosphatase)
MLSHTNRILLADDETRSRRLLERYLETWGFNVTAVDDGLQAMDILERSDAPCLALIDWVMPGMEGVEICQRVRLLTERSYTYLILLTGKSDKEAVTAGLDAGADDYVTKPYDLSELRARLKVGQRVLSLENMLAQQVSALRQSLDHVRQLKDLLPICAWCKRVRDDADYWHNIEEYLHEHTGTDFTHGICPHCLEVERKRLLDDPLGLKAKRPDRRRDEFRIA